MYTGDIYICTADEQDFPIFASWYDPFIETDSEEVANIQCQEPCHLLGDGTPVVEAYARFAACPLGWYARWLSFPRVGVRQCRDHGGDIRLTCGDRGGTYMCWIPIDFLETEQPWFAYQFLEWVELAD